MDFKRHHICRGLSVSNDLKCRVVVSFVDIGGIIDHHRLYFPFIILFNNTGHGLLQHTQKCKP
jgi:hypothetical protein